MLLRCGGAETKKTELKNQCKNKFKKLSYFKDFLWGNFLKNNTWLETLGQAPQQLLFRSKSVLGVT